MKYRKKPVNIDAFQYFGDNYPEWFRWLDGWCECENVFGHKFIEIDTLEGLMKAYYGDYIIRGVKGELYPCKADIFEMTYESLGDAE